jgi:hypothetical protein
MFFSSDLYHSPHPLPRPSGGGVDEGCGINRKTTIEIEKLTSKWIWNREEGDDDREGERERENIFDLRILYFWGTVL